MGTPYSDVLIANGGSPPYPWSILSGALPDGLVFSAAGTISGTPTKAGAFAFSARATDTAGGSSAGGINIAIAPPQLLISTSSLPNGIAQAAYPAQALTVTGGMPPYAFSITSGALPAGLSMTNGQISGIPASSGAFTFSITATDAAGNTVSEPLSIAVGTPRADLILAFSSLSFSLASGATGLPASASIPVSSSVAHQLLNYAVSVSPVVPWLDVAGGGTTPGSIAVSIDPQALNLPASAAPYQTSVTVTCLAPSPCAGNAQTVSVSLSVTSPAPQLTLSTGFLSFSGSASNPQVQPQTLGLQNSGGGVIGIRSVNAADGWVSISGVPPTLTSGPAQPVTVSVDPTGLAPGYYRSTITVTSSAGSATVPVGLLYAQNQTMNLNPAGAQFNMQTGGAPGSTSGSFLVSASGTSAINWTATVQPGAPWLTVSSPGGSSTSANPSPVSYSVDPAAVAALSAQTYYGVIQISSGDAINSPQAFEVVLTVSPPAATVQLDPEPAGLIFVSNGSAALPPQQVQVFAGSTAGVTYQSAANTSDGNAWLTVSPATSQSSAATPGVSSVSAGSGTLTPGVYTGGVSYGSGAAVRTVNVTLIVQPTPSKAVAAGDVPRVTSTCTATQSVAAQTGLVNNFSRLADFPVPLAIQLVDNCGSAITAGQVGITFSNGDPPLVLTPVDTVSGTYLGTWTPRNPSTQVTVLARAATASFAPATTQITGQVIQNPVPVLAPNGALHVFNPVTGAAVAPGNILQIYGSNLSSATAAAAGIPLPTTLGGTSVTIGGISVPLYYVSPGQINVQAPFELIAGARYQIQVNSNGALSAPDSVQIAAVAPGVAALSSGFAIAQHLDASRVTEASPAEPGEIVVLYLAGLGLTDNPVATGGASPLNPLASASSVVSATLDGGSATVLFAGMTPGLVGLYQIKLQVPLSATDGDLPLIVSQMGVLSNTTILPVPIE